ncbi:MAG: hypothetical protein WDN03_08440 [Rhizomicrobium sp.]
MTKTIRNALLGTVAACAALAFVATANAQGDRNSMSNNAGRDMATPGVSVEFGNVAYGYNDGYWDNGHTWHHWNNDAESQRYRLQSPANYHDWHHDRDSNQGWLRN